MHHFGLPNISGGIARYAVVETHSDGNNYVGFAGQDIGAVVAVHSEPSHVVWVVNRHGRKAKQRTGAGNVGFFNEGFEFVHCARNQHAVAKQNIGFFGVVNQFGGASQVFFFGNEARFVAGQTLNFFVFKRFVREARLRVAGEINDHWPRLARPRNVKCFGHDFWHFVGVGDLVVPLANGRGNANHVGFLKSIGAEQRGAHLAHNAHQRGAINDGIGNGRDEVGATWPRRNQAYPYFAARAGVALGGVSRALFVPHQNVVEAVHVAMKRVVGGHNGSAWVAKNGIYAFGQQDFHHGLCARQEWGRRWFGGFGFDNGGGFLRGHYV